MSVVGAVAKFPPLERFLPRRLLAQLESAEGPCERRFEGVALLVDISGYSELTDRLCGAGNEGLEELSRLLGTSFEQYIDVVQSHGGEVVCFAGDALLAFWPTDLERRGRAANDAWRCGRRLLALSEREEITRSANPDLHLGIAAGSMWAARLGGFEGRWQVLLGGTAVREACRALGRARRGEVATGGKFDDWLTLPSPTTDASETPSRAPSEDRSATGWHDSLLPRVVRERIDAGQDAWLAELRHVHSLFVRIDGLDEERDSLSRFQEAAVELQRTLRRYSGSTGQLVIDDKGLVLTVSFGLPFNAHANDGLRACGAGLAVEETLRRLGLSAVAGIAAGPAFCGAIGHRSRSEYVTVGRPMNLAALLMGGAGQGLLVAAISPELASRLETDPAPALEAKGVGLVSPLRVRAVRDVSEAALHGREEELSFLRGRLDALQRGEGGVVLVTGEAGVGKSQLLRAAKQLARASATKVLLGEAAPTDYPAPYDALRSVFAELVDEIRPGDRDLLPLVAGLLPVACEETDASRRYRGKARADAAAKLLADLLVRAASDEPLLVALEDAHWMDSASFALIAAIARRRPRVLFVITSRPASAFGELDALRDETLLAQLALGPLPETALAQLASARLGDAVDAAVIAAVHERTGGNPLFAIELLLLLATTGRLVRNGARFAFASGTGDLPAEETSLNVLTTITSRFDGLSPDEQLVAKTASVIGPKFSVAMLQAIHPEGLDPSSLARALRGLEACRILVPRDEESSSYRFAHAQIRRVAYGLMLFEQRRGLHRRLALELETVASDRGAAAAALFHHWELADDPSRALFWADHAANHALRLGAYREARRFLERCLELTERAPTDGRRIGWYRKLSDAAVGSGTLAERHRHASAGLVLAGRPIPKTRLRLVAEGAGRLVRHRLVPSPRRPRREDELCLELAELHRHLAIVGYFQNDGLELLYHLTVAIEHANRCAPSPVLACAHAELGGALGIAGLDGAARTSLRRALSLAEEIGDLGAIARTHLLNALYLVGVGDWEEVRRSTTATLEVADRLGDHVNWGNAKVVRFWLHYYVGETDEATQAALDLLERATRAGNVQHQGWASRCLALCFLDAREDDEARRLLEAALPLVTASEDVNEVLPTRAALALAWVRTGARQKGRTLARDVLRKMRGEGRPTGHATLAGRLCLLEVVEEWWKSAPRDPEPARHFAQALRSLATYRTVFPIGEPAHLLWRGRGACVDGKGARALRDFEAGLRVAHRRGLRPMARELSEALRQCSKVRSR